MTFSIKDLFSRCDQIRSFLGKLHFLCSVRSLNKFPKLFVIWHRIFIKISKMFSFGFFQKVFAKVLLVFVFLLIYFCPIAQNLERFIIFFSSSFVINIRLFALRYFCFIGAYLFKISIKTLRKCWYSILYISCFNILFSSAILNSSLWKFR